MVKFSVCVFFCAELVVRFYDVCLRHGVAFGRRASRLFHPLSYGVSHGVSHGSVMWDGGGCGGGCGGGRGCDLALLCRARAVANRPGEAGAEAG